MMCMCVCVCALHYGMWKSKDSVELVSPSMFSWLLGTSEFRLSGFCDKHLYSWNISSSHINTFSERRKNNCQFYLVASFSAVFLKCFLSKSPEIFYKLLAYIWNLDVEEVGNTEGMEVNVSGKQVYSNALACTVPVGILAGFNALNQ